jgi:hypothetical protein
MIWSDSKVMGNAGIHHGVNLIDQDINEVIISHAAIVTDKKAMGIAVFGDCHVVPTCRDSSQWIQI